MREDRQRLDKWLWFARLTKTRSQAARLVADGYVRVNGVRSAEPAKALAMGDTLTIALPRATRVVRVEDLGRRRGPPAEAALLYRDLARDDPPLVTAGAKV